jgi:uncharacterized protein (TIGR02145 family)
MIGRISIKNLLLILSVLSLLACTKDCPQENPQPTIEYNGYKYPIIEIGSQWWFAEDLKTTKYSNGDDITWKQSNEDWVSNSFEGAYSINNCEYINWNIGYHYNWIAVNDGRNICPNGWRVPTYEDFSLLLQTTGGSLSGYSLRDTIGWTDYGKGTNGFGFNMNPNYLREEIVWNTYYTWYDACTYIGRGGRLEDYDDHFFYLWGIDKRRIIDVEPCHLISEDNGYYTAINTSDRHNTVGQGMCVRCIKE